MIRQPPRRTRWSRSSLQGRTSPLPPRMRLTVRGRPSTDPALEADALRGASSARRPVPSKETPSMLADFEKVLDRLNLVSRNGEKAMCFCPVHDDRNNPSLSLKV